MKRENDLQALQQQIAELETENTALRAELQKLQIKENSESLPAKSFCPQASKPEQLTLYVSNKFEQPTPEKVSTPIAQRPSPSTIDQTSSPLNKIHLFRSLFRGRENVYALRWVQQKSGYSPTCGNEWVYGFCEKGRIPCSKCSHRSLLTLTDNVLYRHLAGKDPLARDVVGLYPMLSDEGIPVLLCQKALPSFCIIDGRIVWYGSANPLGYPKAEESCIRMNSPALAAELMDYLRSLPGDGMHVPPSSEIP